VELRDVAGRKSGIAIEAIPLMGSFPRYAEANEVMHLPQEEAVIGLAISTHNSEGQGSKRVIYAPGLANVDDRVVSTFDSADLLFVDGTFWSEDELCASAGRTASQMGHLAISGAHGSLKSLGNLKTPRKVFIHINNTNPILDEESPQRREVRAAGWEVARDGVEFTL
jgi:pyrroloquinoline quinone biosynthesis protein B